MLTDAEALLLGAHVAKVDGIPIREVLPIEWPLDERVCIYYASPNRPTDYRLVRTPYNEFYSSAYMAEVVKQARIYIRMGDADRR